MPPSSSYRHERALHLAGALLLGLFFVYLGWSDVREREALWQQQLSAQANVQKLAVEQSQQAIRRQALMAAQGLAQHPDTLRLIRRIAVLAADDDLQRQDLIRLRGQLMYDLSGFWRTLQEAGADQLQIHLSPGPVSLLRMHQPDTWGDNIADERPMVAQVQRTGELLSGMETSRYGPGMRGIVPIRATDADGSPVIASLEVGFGTLPELHQLDIELQSGLALLLDPKQMLQPTRADTAPLSVALEGREWWLAEYSRPEILGWLASDDIPDLVAEDSVQTLNIGERYFLMTRIAVEDFNESSGDPAAMVLIWRDITQLWQQHQSESHRATLAWLLAFVAALIILAIVMLASREGVRHREKVHQDRLRDEVRKREQSRQLLDIISQAQSAYITSSNLGESFDQLLQQIIALTGSRYGFVGQVLSDEHGQPYLKTYAIRNLDWDDQNRDLYMQTREQGIIFSRLDTLFGQVLTHAEPYISNDPENDPHPGDMPAGLPAMKSFLGLPILFGDQLVGAVSLANRPGGYTTEDIDFLSPLLSTLGQLVYALRRDREERAIRRRLDRQREALRALNEIGALPGLETVDRLGQALKLGCNYLKMEVGIVSRITEDDYLVIAQHSSGNQVKEGQQFALGSTYCELTLKQDDVLPIEFMRESLFKEHPGYRASGFESYIGIGLSVNNERYGTLSFSAANPRQQPFDDTDLEFMRLLGRWINGSLGRWRMEKQRSALLRRFNKLTQHLPGVVYQYQLSADGHAWFPYCSPGMFDICGVTPEQAHASSDSVLQAIHEDDRDLAINTIIDSARQLTTWRQQFRVNHPVKGELWLSGVSTPERLDNGDVIWHGFFTDITARKRMELSLERERARLESIIQATNVGTWEWNLETGETLLNERWAEMLGYRLSELLPLSIDTFEALSHPEDLVRSKQLIQSHIAGEIDYYDCKSRLRHKNGQWVWVISRGRVISLDAQGKPAWMSGTHADITEEMHRDAEITRARAFLHAVIDASTEVAVITTDLDGVITLFNSGAEKLLGYSAAETIGAYTLARFHLPSEIQLRAESLSKELGYSVSANETLFANIRQSKAETLPWTYVHKDGTQRLVKLTVTGILDNNGSLSGYLGVATDITDLIQATRALQKSEASYRSMVSNLPGAVYRCNHDAAWTMSYMSDEISVITGYPAEDFIDSSVRSYASVVHPEDLTLTYQAVENVNRQKAYELSYRIIHAHGHEVWVKEKGRGEFDANGELLWLSGFIWDATEQQRIDELKSRFVSTVSHELRTPLTSIGGSLALINNGVLGPVPENMRKLLTIAENNSQQLNVLINDLLDMDKLEAGKMHFELRQQPLSPVLQTALENNRSYAERLQVTLEAGRLDPVLVSIDATRLGQILNNYLSNAAKFSHPGGSVTLDAVYSDGKVRISVTDQGDGIDADFQPQIFSKFSQADATDKRKRGGTGLGLAITRELAINMGGEVGFSSEPGLGSCFWCELEGERDGGEA